MKRGYIVMNDSNYGNEFFGVFEDRKKAEQHLRKVVRNRFGKCPRDLDDLVDEPYTCGGDDSYKLIYFEEEI